MIDRTRPLNAFCSHGARACGLAACCALLAATGAVTLGPGTVDAPSALFVDILAALSLAPLILSARNIYRANFGSAVAWSCVALPTLVLSFLLSLHLIHPSRFLGLVSCDAMADDCGVPPLTQWLPAIFFAASGVLTAVSIEASKAAAGPRASL